MKNHLSHPAGYAGLTCSEPACTRRLIGRSNRSSCGQHRSTNRTLTDPEDLELWKIRRLLGQMGVIRCEGSWSDSNASEYMRLTDREGQLLFSDWIGRPGSV